MHGREAMGMVLGLVALAGCAHREAYTWVDALPESELASQGDSYVVQVGDVLSVHVLNQDAMNVKAKVRSDGKISLPFLHDVEVAGSTPQILAEQLQTRLKDYVASPVVTVQVEEPRPIAVSVVGEVGHPGVYTVDSGSGVLEALAAAGGLGDFADRKRIFVVRRGKQIERVRFRYEDLAQASGRAGSFSLRRGDVVVVE